MKQKNRKKLEVKILIAYVSLTLILIFLSCVGVGWRYWKSNMKTYGKRAYAYSDAAAKFIDGDKAVSYLKTGKKDAYYDSIQRYLDANQKASELKYFFVFVPNENDLVYIWDAQGEGDAVSLGYHEEYLKGENEDIMSAFSKKPSRKLSITKDPEYGYIASAYSPIYNKKGEPVAIVGADLYMPDIQNRIRSFIYTIIFVIFIVIGIPMIGFFIAVRKRIIQPINKLSSATKSMVGNLEDEKNLEIDIHTGDEFEELADSFVQMGQELRDYIHEVSVITAEKERIGAELDVATHIQASMLPCIFPAFPERQEFDIYATMNPAKEVGGDFYDFFMVDEENLAIVMADVSGKGVPAALFMVIAKTLIKDHTMLYSDLGQVFTKVNSILCESNSEELFVTAFEGVLNLTTGEFRFVNAGHEIPYICRTGGTYEPYKTKAGFVLAGMEDMKYTSGSFPLNPGDKIFLYTDGVTEAMNKNSELYGMTRLSDVLKRNSKAQPMELLPIIKNDIDAFVGEAPQFDDITMLCLEYKEGMK